MRSEIGCFRSKHLLSYRGPLHWAKDTLNSSKRGTCAPTSSDLQGLNPAVIFVSTKRTSQHRPHFLPGKKNEEAFQNTKFPWDTNTQVAKSFRLRLWSQAEQVSPPPSPGLGGDKSEIHTLLEIQKTKTKTKTVQWVLVSQPSGVFG